MKKLMVEVEDSNEKTKHITDNGFITIRVFVKKDGDHLLMREIRVTLEGDEISYLDEQFETGELEVKDEMHTERE